MRLGMLRKYSRIIGIILADVLIVNLSFFLAAVLRFETLYLWLFNASFVTFYTRAFLPISAAYVLAFALSGIYKSLWKYSGIDEILKLFIVSMSVTGGIIAVMYLADITFKGITVIAWLFIMFFASVVRTGSRLFTRLKTVFQVKLGKNENTGSRRRVLVVGAGVAGSMIVRELAHSAYDKYEIVCIVDDDPAKLMQRMHGVEVRGRIKDIPRLVDMYDVDDVIIAIPSATPEQLNNIVDRCPKDKCRVRIMPLLSELGGEQSISSIRDINIDDLLGRDAVDLNNEGISAYLRNATVLVTGGGGSIGSELCRQILRFRPKKLIVFDMYENNAYDLYNELKIKYNITNGKVEVIIGSVCDEARLEQVFGQRNIDVVFHAAAYKHVPLMEAAPAEAVRNNIFGTYRVATAAKRHGVKRFVMISTDKAVNPTNIMGATKRMAELVIQSLSRSGSTEFVAVRFGNVLGSNGSVVPIFKRQIENGGPVTITHPEVTRFFMTIPEAAQLVIQASALAHGGETFILDMGEPVKIVDLARKMIRLSGYEPDVDIKIEFIGLRPGEKLYEELLLSEEGLTKTPNKKIYIAKPNGITEEEAAGMLQRLDSAVKGQEDVKKCLVDLLPTYKPVNNGNGHA